jgi:hypothetical protein
MSNEKYKGSLLWFHTDDDNRLRLCLVKEGEKGYFPLGEVTNDPDALMPRFFKSVEEAEAFCISANQRLFGLSPEQQNLLVFRSMALDDWRVLRDPDTDQVTLLKDGDEVAVLSGDDADSLYRQLKYVLFPYGDDDEE